jgi:hypothetical protein
MIKPKILQPKGKLATVVLNSSSYLGGAHGSTSQRYYNFDLANQKQIQLHDLLLPKQKATLDKLAHEAFKVWIVDSKLPLIRKNMNRLGHSKSPIISYWVSRV